MQINHPNRKNRLYSLAFVFIQIIILAGLVLLNNDVGPQTVSFPTAGSILEWVGIAGIVISAYSIRTVLTAEPLPRQYGELSTGGIYSYVRHPMYTSVMLFSLGIAVTGGSVIKFALLGLLTVLFYFKAKFEEKFLLLQYPKYEEYANRTPQFIPFTHVLKGKYK
jgi:protein-S-isoprenylcysteine O-methyltransferase Ste14